MHLILPSKKVVLNFLSTLSNISIHLIILHPPNYTTTQKYLGHFFLLYSPSKKKKKEISLLIHYLNFQVTTRPATKSHAEQKIQYHFPTRIVRPPHGKRYEDTANPFKREERVNVGEQLSKRQNTLVHKGGIKHPASNHDLANRSRSIRFEGND